MSDIVPDYMTALVGYRAWNLSPECDLLSIASHVMEPWPCQTKKQAICTHVSAPGMVLSSTSMQPVFSGAFEEIWQRRSRKRALRNHHPPEPTCCCGIYAAKSNTSSEFLGYTYGAKVWGEVYLWGRIQEYSEGYRAEFAYPKSLKTIDQILALKIGERYGVPCEVVAVRAVGDMVTGTPPMVWRSGSSAIMGRRGGKRPFMDVLGAFCNGLAQRVISNQ